MEPEETKASAAENSNETGLEGVRAVDHDVTYEDKARASSTANELVKRAHEELVLAEWREPILQEPTENIVAVHAVFEQVEKRISRVHETLVNSILPKAIPELNRPLHVLLDYVQTGMMNKVCEVDEDELEMILTQSLVRDGVSRTFGKVFLKILKDKLEHMASSLDNIGACVLVAAEGFFSTESNQGLSASLALRHLMTSSADPSFNDQWVDGLADRLERNHENLDALEEKFLAREEQALQDNARLKARRENFDSLRSTVNSQDSADSSCPFCGMYRALVHPRPDTMEPTVAERLRQSQPDSPTIKIPSRECLGGEIEESKAAEGEMPYYPSREEGEPGEQQPTNPNSETGSLLTQIKAAGLSEELLDTISRLLEEKQAVEDALKTSQAAREEAHEAAAKAEEARVQFITLHETVDLGVQASFITQTSEPDQADAISMSRSVPPESTRWLVSPKSTGDYSRTWSPPFSNPGWTLEEELDQVVARESRAGCWCCCQETVPWVLLSDVVRACTVNPMRRLGLLEAPGRDRSPTSTHGPYGSERALCFPAWLQLLQVAFNICISISLIRERDRWLQGNGLTRMYLVEYMESDPSFLLLPGVDLRFVWEGELTKHIRRVLPQFSSAVVAGLLAAGKWFWFSFFRRELIMPFVEDVLKFVLRLM